MNKFTMSAGQNSGTGAMTEFEDEKVRKDGKGVPVDEQKDNPSNRRPSTDDGTQTDDEIVAQEAPTPAPDSNVPESTDAPGKIDRPGFALVGSTGETRAGKGLGLGSDAKKDKKGWRLPR